MGFLVGLTFVLLVSIIDISSAAELSIMEVSTDIWNASSHFGDSIKLDLQEKKGADVTYSELITSVDDKVWDTDSVKYFNTLLEGYEVNDTDSECVNNFLNEILDGEPINILKKFLTDNDLVEDADFEKEFRRIWFSGFEDEDLDDMTSGFELTFQGLLSDSSVHAVHNWQKYYQEESTGNITYKGYIKTQTIEQLPFVVLGYDWNGTDVSETTIPFGTRPEYEMAIYTLCWYVKPGDDCFVYIDDTDDEYVIKVKSEVSEYDGEKYVKAAYMDLNSSSSAHLRPDVMLSILVSFLLCWKQWLW